MYSDVKFCVKINGSVTECFRTNVGVKQGCVLSPKLFNLYINDIPTIFDNTCDPATINSEILSCLMYADDLVLLSSTEKGLHSSINCLRNYLSVWKLELNTTQVIVLIRVDDY